MHSVAALKNHIQKLKPTLGGRLLCTLLPASTKVAMQNMQIAFGPALTAEEYQKLMHCFASHVVKTGIEIIKARFLSKKQIIQRVEVRHLENAVAALKKERGVLLLTAHLGNWEFAPLGAALQLKNVFKDGFHIVRKKVPNPLLEKFLFSHFEQAGIHILAKGNSLRPLFRILAKNGAVIITFDQYVKPGSRGILAKFFDQPVGTYTGLAKLAKKTGAAVVPVVSYRTSSGSHVLEFLPEIEWISHKSSEEEIRLNTEAYNLSIENAIWEHPEQWQWRHRRFRQ